MNSLFTKSLAAVASLMFMPAMVQTVSAQDGKVDFSYDTGRGSYGWWGTQKIEVYDVAIGLNDPDLVGKTVEGVKIQMSETEKISDGKIWLTTALTLEDAGGKKVNVPNICSQSVDFESGLVEYTFDQPYTITSEGLYVGYTFKSGDAKADAYKYPVCLTSEAAPGGFYLHSDRTVRTQWEDYSASYCSTMKVVLSGVKADAVRPTLAPTTAVTYKQEFPLKVKVTNVGSTPVSNFDYSYELAGQTYTGTCTLDSPLPTIYGAYEDVTITCAAVPEPGVYPLNFTVTKVNGNANACDYSASVSETTAYKVFPKHRAVMEEYTGTWCGYCPRGFASMQIMNKLHPEDFVCISYHNGDDMEVTSRFPSAVSGFPTAYLDRAGVVDAWYGTSNSNDYGFEAAWLDRCATLAPAAMQATGVISDDESTVTVRTDLTFAKDVSPNQYKIEFVLLANGLTGTGSRWEQHNYYTGAGGFGAYPEMMQFVNGGSVIKGLIFDDVFVASSRIEGEDAYLSDSYVIEDVASESYTFNLGAVKNVSGGKVIQDNGQLTVVALLVNTDNGQIENAAKAHVVTAAGVDNVRADQLGATTCFDLSGRQITGLKSGVNIVKDASGRAHKVLVK